MNDTFPRSLLLAGAAITLVVALASGVGFARLAAPSDFEHRLAGLSVQAADVSRLARERPGPDRLRFGAVCARAGAQADVLRNQIQSQASTLGLSVSGLRVEPGAAGSVRPIDIHFEIAGPYDRALAMIAGLHQLSPQIFADSLDMVSKTSSVTLAFTGRAFCSA